MDPILEIDVGGKIFRTYKSTIDKFPNSKLSKLTHEGQKLFFDRDPRLFKTIIKYYRTGILDDKKDIDHELIFWELIESPLSGPKKHREMFIPFPAKYRYNQGVTFSFVEKNDRTMAVLVEGCKKIYGITIECTNDVSAGLILGYLPIAEKDHLYTLEEKKEMATSICGLESVPQLVDIKTGEKKHIQCNPPLKIEIDIEPCITICDGRMDIDNCRFTLIYE
jgi:hypothetical protein